VRNQTDSHREAHFRATRLRRFRGVATAGTVAAALVVHMARARGESDARRVPGPLERSRSVAVSDVDGTAIKREPSREADVVGRTMSRVRLPVLELRQASGCRQPWVRIGDEAWVCGDRVQPSGEAPNSASVLADQRSGPLPWDYVFTAANGIRAYRSVDAALRGDNDDATSESWEANWGMAVQLELLSGNARVLRTRNGFFLQRGAVYRATPSTFAGGTFETLEGDEPGIPFGWIAVGGTFVYPEAHEARAVSRLPRLSRVRVYALRPGERGKTFARIGPGQWVRADHVRWIAPAPPPETANLAASEHWIDVDLTSQTLIAYEGVRPVYATMVSTGDRLATQPGLFHVWGKYLAHTMDNTESTGVRGHYRLGDVPWVQFFDRDRGFHAVYWHDEFGVPRSHGCVNMAPRDAEFLFHFTNHALPEGWISRMIPAGAGTLVRVRGRFVTQDPS